MQGKRGRQDETKGRMEGNEVRLRGREGREKIKRQGEDFMTDIRKV